ncbi:MAG: phosphoribosylglycinamide formyltransferase [Candidatus Dormiibacterota bacterium]
MGAAVLVSGRGTNLRALLEAAADPRYPARIVAVAANRSSCPALEVAEAAAVPARVFRLRDFGGDGESRDRALAEWALAMGASCLVLAGYDRILGRPLLAAFAGRILNVHNSLLPAFSGTMSAVAEALAHGVKVSGCTVHLVDAGITDGGPIVLQAAVPVQEGDTEDALLERIHQEEWRLLPQALALLAEGRVRVEGRRARILEAAR